MWNSIAGRMLPVCTATNPSTMPRANATSDCWKIAWVAAKKMLLMTIAVHLCPM